MSVQAGIWNLDGEPVNRALLERISLQTQEYGPDGEASHLDGNIGMLYRPFNTTAESRLEHQPYFLGNGKVMTWDGRLDNREELIRDLQNALKDDHTDACIAATAFCEWGAHCFSKFNGDWAITIWDPYPKELLLARDYIGIRHLFYYPERSRIVWCNHLAALALSCGPFAPCDEYIAGHLAADPDAHLTPYSGVHSVPPGHFVRLRADRKIVTAYWHFDPNAKTYYKTNAEYEEQYRHLFRQSVRRRLRTDSPILADLSGGFDSTAIVCMADDIAKRETPGAPDIDTFSLQDSNEPEADDLPYFTKVENKRGKQGFHADLKESGASICFDPPAFIASPTYEERPEIQAALAAALRRSNYRVILSGRGGDDINGQPLDPRVPMADLLLDLRFVSLAKDLTAWSLLIRKRPWIQLFFQTLLQTAPLWVQKRLADQARVEPWIQRQFAREYDMSARQLNAVKGFRFSRPSVRDACQTIATLARRMSKAAPTVSEKRYPYLDQQLVEFLTSVPLDQLLRPGQRRFLMRRALRDLLPSEVLARKSKASFARYHSAALQANWKRAEEIFSSPFSCRLGYINSQHIKTALLALKNGQTPTYLIRLLNAISLELWLRDGQARGVILI